MNKGDDVCRYVKQSYSIEDYDSEKDIYTLLDDDFPAQEHKVDGDFFRQEFQRDSKKLPYSVRLPN